MTARKAGHSPAGSCWPAAAAPPSSPPSGPCAPLLGPSFCLYSAVFGHPLCGQALLGNFVFTVSFSLHKDPLRKYNYYLPHLTGRETEAQRLHWPQVTSALNDISIFAALLVKEEPETEFKEECQQSHCLIFISKSRSVNSQCKMGLQTE